MREGRRNVDVFATRLIWAAPRGGVFCGGVGYVGYGPTSGCVFELSKWVNGSGGSATGRTVILDAQIELRRPRALFRAVGRRWHRFTLPPLGFACLHPAEAGEVPFAGLFNGTKLCTMLVPTGCLNMVDGVRVVVDYRYR